MSESKTTAQGWFEALTDRQSTRVAAYLQQTQGACCAWVDGQGQMALHYVAQWPAPQGEGILGWLMGAHLTQGIPLDALDQYGVSPLGYAIISEQDRLARLFLQAGVDPRAKAAPYQATAYSALHAAVLFGRTKLVDALLEADQAQHPHEAPGVNWAEHDDGHRLLHLAATVNHWALVTRLLGRPDIEAQALNAQGHPFWWYAQDPHALASVHAHTHPSTLRDRQGRSVLHYAIDRNSEAMAQAWLEQAPLLLAVPDDQGDTPLHVAIARRQPGIITLLTEQGADWHVPNGQGETPLQCLERVAGTGDAQQQSVAQPWRDAAARQALARTLTESLPEAATPIPRTRL